MAKKRIIYQYTSDNSYMNLPDEFEGDLPRAEYEDETQELMGKRRAAIKKYSGMNKDRDMFNDGMEIQVGTHNEQNVPLHKNLVKRYGPETPGSARVERGRGVVFNYDNSLVDLRVKPTGKTIGGKPIMKSPKTMKLSVDFGSAMNHVNKTGGYKMDINVHPEKHRLDDTKIKKIGIMGIKKQVEGEKKGVEKLAGGITNMGKIKRKSPAIDLPGASRLDFSHVGITKGVNNKKIRGFTI